MKVCFVSHSAERGGAERSLLDTIRVLRARGVRCSVVLPAAGPLADDLAREGIEPLRIRYRWWVGPAGGPLWRRLARTAWNLATALPLARVVRRAGADVVYTNTITVGSGAVAAALAGRPHVWHLREYGREHHGLVFDIGERLALRAVPAWSALCFANAEGVAAKYRRFAPPGRVVVVPQWVPGPPAGFPSEPPADGRFHCVCVGWLGREKRQDEAVAAVARLVASGIDAELELVGGGDPAFRKELEGRIAALALGERVRLTGPVAEAWPALARANAVVVCSRFEAFGRVTVEAMLGGRPVAGARSGGTAELIEDGVRGLLYEPGDVDALAAILGRLASEPATARRLAGSARLWAAERFTEERYGEAILSGLSRVLR